MKRTVDKNRFFWRGIALLSTVWMTAACTEDEHDEPTYEDTNRGWPSFASKALGDFFASLP